MPLDHERFDVYQRALDFVVLADELSKSLPRGMRHLSEQLARASTSIVLNIAEGAGKFSKPEKRRFYMIARGSATECAAILDVCARLGVGDGGRISEGSAMLVRVVSMLVRLVQSVEG